MELDELKQPWKISAEKIPPVNIGEMIRQQAADPLHRLKRRFRSRMIVLPLVLTWLIINLSKHHDIFSDVLFWLYVVICIGMTGYFYAGYRQVSRIQDMDGPVKSMLEKRVRALEQGLRWRLICVRILFVVFIVLLEIMLFYKQEPSLAAWYALPIYLRLAVYAGLTGFFYLLTGWILGNKYGKYIRRLRELVEQMQ
jgi:hypothetical protein